MKAAKKAFHAVSKQKVLLYGRSTECKDSLDRAAVLKRVRANHITLTMHLAARFMKVSTSHCNGELCRPTTKWTFAVARLELSNQTGSEESSLCHSKQHEALN